MLESAIVRTILRHLNALPGCYARKMHGGPYSAGLPDVFCCYQGHMYALEVKRPGGRLTALQAAELEHWRRAGATAAVVTSWAEVEAVLNGLAEYRDRCCTTGTDTSPATTCPRP